MVCSILNHWYIINTNQNLTTSVYKTIDIITKQWYAIKLELSLDGDSSVEREYSLLRDLNRAGIPRVHWFGQESNYDALVLDLLGPSLHQIMSQHKKLHLCTIVLLANQLVFNILSVFHSWVHNIQ